MTTIDEQIALFRFKIIAPVLHSSAISQQEYFNEQAKINHELPGNSPGQTFTFKPATFKKWLHLYRKFDFDGLRPNHRNDRGVFRKIPNGIEKNIRELLQDNVFRTIKNLYEYLSDLQLIDTDNCTYQTFCNFIKAKKLWNTFQTQKKRKSWEKPSINMLWTGDFTYSIYINVPGKKSRKQVYLCAFIDDYSRLITGAEFAFTMDTIAMEKVLKDAFSTYGIPNAIYLDNGKPFVQEGLVLTGAKLGFQVIHSKPGDPASRGKIERYYRTVKDRFVNPFMLRHKNKEISLEYFNAQFKSWLYKEYQNKKHSGIEMTPHQKYMSKRAKVHVREFSRKEINKAFLHKIRKKVSRHALVSIDNIKYEVPGQYIDEWVELEFNPAEPGTYYIYEEGRLEPFLVRPVDAHKNSKIYNK